MEVVGEAGTAAEALARIPAIRPDVTVIDAWLPDGNGVEVSRAIRSHNENIRCLMLTPLPAEEALFQAIMAGAVGYLHKAIHCSRLLAAVREVAAGKSLLDPVATARMLNRLRDTSAKGLAGAEHSDGRLAHLTVQERRVLELTTMGFTDRAIGARLNLPEETIRHDVSGLLTKLPLERHLTIAA